MTAKIEVSGELAAMVGDWDTMTYTPNGDPHPSSKTRTINGIFNRDYLEDSGAMSSQPAFRCAHADVDDISSGALMTGANDLGNDVNYTVQGYEPGGLGLIYLLLELT